MANGRPPDDFYDLDGNVLELPNLHALRYDAQNNLASAVSDSAFRRRRRCRILRLRKRRYIVCAKWRARQAAGLENIVDTCYVGDVIV